MNRRIKRALVATITAASAITAAGVWGLTAANAAVLPSYNSTTAAWSTTGHATQWHFRFLTTEVSMIPCPANAAYADIEADIQMYADQDTKTNWGSGIAIHCGGGVGSVRWVDDTFGAGTFSFPANKEPRVGDLLVVSIYHNRATLQDRFMVENVTRDVKRTIFVNITSDVFYQHAKFASYRTQQMPAPGPDPTVLWRFENCRVTSEAFGGHPVTHGGIRGPWPYFLQVVSYDGQPVPPGALLLEPGPIRRHSFEMRLYMP